MHVPLVNLQKQHAHIHAELMAAIARVIDAQSFILGPEVAAFESEVAARLGVEKAVGVASGSDALFLALVAAGIRPGDEVITSPFTFIATAEAIARVGAIPVFADIDEDCFNLDPKKVPARLTRKTRAMLPVHLFGQAARMEELIEVARENGLFVVEDAAQAFDARRMDKVVGTFGDFGCFSFFPSKNLGGWGDGGMVVARRADDGARIMRLRAHGGAKHYVSEEIGVNSRLDALQAAVLRVKLRHLADYTMRRRMAADRYRELFATYELLDFVRLPVDDPKGYHVYNQFTVRCNRRDALMEVLKNAGVGSAVYYPVPLHLQPCFANLGYRTGDFPIAEKACQEVLSLPMHPFLTVDEQTFVVETIRSFYRGGA